MKDLRLETSREWEKNGKHRIYITASWVYNQYGARVHPRDIGYYDIVEGLAVVASGYEGEEDIKALIEGVRPDTKKTVDETEPEAEEPAVVAEKEIAEGDGYTLPSQPTSCRFCRLVQDHAARNAPPEEGVHRIDWESLCGVSGESSLLEMVDAALEKTAYAKKPRFETCQCKRELEVWDFGGDGGVYATCPAYDECEEEASGGECYPLDRTALFRVAGGWLAYLPGENFPRYYKD